MFPPKDISVAIVRTVIKKITNTPAIWSGVKDNELVFVVVVPQCTVFTLLSALFQKDAIVPARADQSDVSDDGKGE